MKVLDRLGGVVLASLFLAAAPANAQNITVSGPEPLVEVLLPAAIEAFVRSQELSLRRRIESDGAFALEIADPSGGRPGLTMFIRKSDTVAALSDLAAGQSVIALTDRRATAAEHNAIPGLQGILVARDALVPVVSRDNPIRAVSTDQLVAIVSGQIANWSDIGGPDKAIALHLTEPGSAPDRLLTTWVMGGEAARAPARIHITDEGLADTVAADPAAIGIARLSEVANARALPLTGDCGIAVAPTRLAIKNADYPMISNLMFYHRGNGMPRLLAELIAFLPSEAAQGAIRQVGFVDNRPEEATLTDHAERLLGAISIVGRAAPPSDLRRYGEMLRSSHRLSYTFRMTEGTTLDDGSTAALMRLAEKIAAGRFDGRTLRVVGFTDGIGTPDQNRAVGLSRARAVAAQLSAAAGEGADVAITPDSFGESVPIACDDSEWGRALNRRIEIWVE